MEDVALPIGNEAGAAGDAERRRLASALALSVLLHLVILVSAGDSGAWRAPHAQMALLTVRIQDVAPAIEATERAVLPSSETILNARSYDPRPSAAKPLPVAALPVSAPVEPPERIVVTTAPVDVPRLVEAPPPAAAPAALAQRVGEWIRELPSADPHGAELTWQQDGRPYKAVLTRRPAGDATDLERYDVEIVSPTESGRWETGLSFRRLAFSHFTQFVDRWDEGVQLHDDEISGRFHANSPIVIGYDRQAAPRFVGKVTTTARGVRFADAFGRRRREDIFVGGLEIDAEPIRMPRHAELLDVEAPHDGGHRRSFGRDTRIRFHADGSYGWSELRHRGPWQTEELPEDPLFLLAGPGAELRVSGTVRGQVLVYSPERIVIEGDLVYARDPRTEPNAEDLLGLVCAGRIEVAPPHVTGRGDLEIHAAIYALRRFVVTHTDAPRSGTLRIYGSLTAGSLSETEPRYATQIDFDPRFEKRRPPGFPMTPRFELESADAGWRLDDG